MMGATAHDKLYEWIIANKCDCIVKELHGQHIRDCVWVEAVKTLAQQDGDTTTMLLASLSESSPTS